MNKITKYGIAFTQHGDPPPFGQIVGWKQLNGINQTWNTCEEALEANDLNGWAGYVCEYPSGRREIIN